MTPRGYKNEEEIASEERISERLKLGSMLLAQTILVVAAFVKMMVDVDYSKKDRAELHAEIKESQKENAEQHKEMMTKLERHMESERK